MDNFRKVSQDLVLLLHLYGGHGWNMQSCCCCNVSSRINSSHWFNKSIMQQFWNERLPCRKDIEPTRIKDINTDREDLARHGKKKRPLVASPKKKYNLLAKSYKKVLPMIYFAWALEKIQPNSILFTVVPKPKIDFVW